MLLPLLLAAATLSPADTAAAFAAAGFRRAPGGWRSCAEDPDARGEVEQVVDLNGDGRAEAIIAEGSMACSGDVPDYWIVTPVAPGRWKLVTSGRGIVTPLATRAPNGWRDLEIGGPGFCFPVHRWTGRDYAPSRFQYDGKPCKPPR